jgi:uncharacterized membrane protein YeaQ/YmgE (transglycosylase-associated protein family)
MGKWQTEKITTFFGLIYGALTAAVTSHAQTSGDLLRDALAGAVGGWVGDYDVDVPSMTGSQLLALAGKPTDRFKLIQRLNGGQAKPVGLNESVSFTDPGVERFMTLPHRGLTPCAASSTCQPTMLSTWKQRN